LANAAMKRLAVISLLVLLLSVQLGSARILKRSLARRQQPPRTQQCTVAKTFFNPWAVDLFVFLKYQDQTIDSFNVPTGGQINMNVCAMYQCVYFVTDNTFVNPDSVSFKQSFWTPVISAGANRYRVRPPPKSYKDPPDLASGFLQPCYGDGSCMGLGPLADSGDVDVSGAVADGSAVGVSAIA